MNTEWEHVNQLFHEAMELESGERDDYIARAVQNDPTLQLEIQSLIAAHEESDSFLENPAHGKRLFQQFDGWRRITDALKFTAGKYSSGTERMIGRLLDGKYEIEALCGLGGMGAVYRATHVGTGRRLAVKVIAPELAGNSEFIERFRREAKMIGLLRHPNIVNVTDFGVTGDGAETVAYLVMEYLEGRTLAERLKDRRPMPVNVAIDILNQVCAAMDEAHRLGVLHRDLKPENIWLEPAGANGSNVKILDFGIARLQDIFAFDELESRPEERETAIRHQPFSITEEETLRLNYTARQMSRFDAVMGTPKYMSPEQCRGERLDKRSDIYSLGVIAYQMLAGETPFTGTASELLVRHRETIPAPIREKRKDVPEGVDEVVRQALAKDRNARPSTAGAFAFLLQLRSAGAQWVRLQADDLQHRNRWKFAEIALRTQWKGWLLSLLLLFATLKLPGMPTAMAVTVFGLLWLAIAAIIIWGQNATTAACALFIEQMERKSKADLRSIIAAVRRRRRDLTLAAFRPIIPPLIHEELSVKEARRRWTILTTLIRRQATYTLFRRVLAFAIALVASQQILTASAFLIDRGREYFNITREVFFHAMSVSMFFWLPVAITIGIAGFNLCTKSAIEQSVIYMAARRAIGEVSSEQRAPLPNSDTWLARWRPRWKTYATVCAFTAFIIGFHLSKFLWMTARMIDADLYSVKALRASGVPAPTWPFKSSLNLGRIIYSSEMMRYLIENGADVNAPVGLDDQGFTPLMSAIFYGSVDTARLLIEGGANARAGNFSNTPMTIAVSNCPAAIELLLASGADVNERTLSGTPLLIAARLQWPYPATQVSFFGSNAQTDYKRPQVNIVKILIEKGADPNARDDAGRNALMTMSLKQFANNDEITMQWRGTKESRRLSRRDDKVVEVIGETLLGAGCDVNAADNKGRTPLIYAVASERLNIVELLLNRGADIHAKDHNGQSALDWALKSGNEEIIKILSSFSSDGGKNTSR